jgi:hypothetical protein
MKMKEIYSKPVADVQEFAVADVVTTSGPEDHDDLD